MNEAGFGEITSHSYEEPVIYSHEAWRGRIRVSAGVGGPMPPEMAVAFDQQLKALLARDFPANPLSVPHRVFRVYGQK